MAVAAKIEMEMGEVFSIWGKEVAAQLRALPRMTEPNDGSMWVEHDALEEFAAKLEKA